MKPKFKFKKDTRDKLWADLELSIQKRATKKDPKFILKGNWKKFVRNQDGFKVFRVDGEWVRNNLSIIFGHGGHGRVHEFIPLNEIWIDTHHEDCKCKNVRKDRKMSKQYTDSTTLHEITECQEMKKGAIFHHAHQTALQKEISAGIIPDPYTEMN